MNVNNEKKVIILDYGLGNLFNVHRAFEIVGANPAVTSDPREVERAERLVLPGVGAFHDGMNGLKTRNLIQPIIEFAKSGRSVLGICLGMQLFMTESEEHGLYPGLNLIDGRVVRFQEPQAASNGKLAYKIPQLGWNRLMQPDKNKSESKPDFWSGTVLKDLSENPYMYFMHSYCVFPQNNSDWLAATLYGRDRYCSVVKRGNVAGCQFHPERSGEQGLSILRNFVFGELSASENTQMETIKNI